MATTFDTQPFRDELLSIERLEERARALAARFTVDPVPAHGPQRLPPLRRQRASSSAQAYRALAADVHRGEFVTPAGEWLLDNYHLVDSEIRVVRQNLPRGYYRELPKLAARDLAGNARVYALAVELIRHSDSRLDRQQLARFLDGFQTVAPLTIGELWAWPSMLKLALIENLRRLAEETLEARAARRAADGYVARIDAAGKGALPPLPRALHAAHVVQLLHRVREYGPRLSAVRRDLDAHVAQGGHTAEEAIRSEHQREAATQVSVANAITSLRLCAEIDWPQYVESVSLVERVLQRDPAGVHGRMEFLSRDRYRQAVEELAEPTGEAQVRVALRAVESAREAAEVEGPGARAAHVGHHLIGKGQEGPGGRRRLASRRRRRAFAASPSPMPRSSTWRRSPSRRRGWSAAGVVYARVGGGSLPGAGGRGAPPAPARERAGHRLRPAPGRPPGPAASPSAPRLRGRDPRGRADPGRRADAPRERGRGATSSSSTSRCWPSGTSTRASTSPSWETSPTPRRGRCPRTTPSSPRRARASRR